MKSYFAFALLLLMVPMLVSGRDSNPDQYAKAQNYILLGQINEAIPLLEELTQSESASIEVMIMLGRATTAFRNMRSLRRCLKEASQRPNQPGHPTCPSRQLFIFREDRGCDRIITQHIGTRTRPPHGKHTARPFVDQPA